MLRGRGATMALHPVSVFGQTIWPLLAALLTQTRAENEDIINAPQSCIYNIVTGLHLWWCLDIGRSWVAIGRAPLLSLLMLAQQIVKPCRRACQVERTLLDVVAQQQAVAVFSTRLSEACLRTFVKMRPICHPHEAYLDFCFKAGLGTLPSSCAGLVCPEGGL